jgi:hypothetical protein
MIHTFHQSLLLAALQQHHNQAIKGRRHYKQ